MAVKTTTIAVPERHTSSIIQSPSGMQTSYYPKLNPEGHYRKSILDSASVGANSGYGGASRIPCNLLRAFSRTVPVRKAIKRITSGVLAMPWRIDPPEEQKNSPAAKKTAEQIRKALLKPNREEHNTYGKFVRAIINELLVLGFAAIERQPGEDDSQPFWLWVANGEHIRVNREWSPTNDDVHRYEDWGMVSANQPPRLISNENLFILQIDNNAYELVPPSPLEIVFNIVEDWLGIKEFQHKTAANAVREYILSIEGDMTQSDLDAFREYWDTEVVNEGKIPIINGKINVVKLGARNDQELYPEYTTHLLTMIALGFDLSMRDMNVEPAHDNRATAGVAADASFQDAVLPMAILVKEGLNEEVVDHYEEGFRYEHIDIEQRTEKEEAERSTMIFEKNVSTRNEARQMVGLEPLPENIGDKFADGTSLKDPEGQANAPVQETGIEEVAIEQEVPSPKLPAVKPQATVKQATKTKGKAKKEPEKQPVAVQLSLF